MRSHLWVTLTLCMIAAPAVFADEPTSKPSFALNAGVESFHWKEFNGDQRLLSETGPRLTVGFMLDHLLQSDQTNPYAVEARAYLGVINYDGQTQTGSRRKPTSIISASTPRSWVVCVWRGTSTWICSAAWEWIPGLAIFKMA